MNNFILPQRCLIDGCESTYRMRKGYCNKHYVRLRRYGDPIKTRNFVPVGETFEERFWSRVEIPADRSQCWLWKAGTLATGYGSLTMNGKHVTAHRVSWHFANGRWPEQFVLHSCDNPSCVNPNHLREGGNIENTQDKLERGRTARGSGIAQSKLTPDEVLVIRAMLAKGVFHKTIAAKFGVARPTISAIATGRNWKYE